MIKNEYLRKLYAECAVKNQDEPEFLQAVNLFLKSVDSVVDHLPSLLESGVLPRLLEPERVIIFRVPWVDDGGRVQVNRGYRIQYNSAIGPYKGGLRFDSSVNLSIMKFLSFEQTFKNALTGLPLGGGKGGADFSPAGKSDGEIMRFCQSFISELYRYIGPGIDVPAGDLGVGAREIGYMFGYYKKIVNRFEGAFTGKGISYGGSFARPEATGYGLCYFTEEMLNRYCNESLSGKRVIISGSGQVGSNAAVKAARLGAKVVAMSDIDGVIYHPNGLETELVHKIKTNRESITLYCPHNPAVQYFAPPAQLWRIPCDVAFPCATQNEIDLAAAKDLVKGGVKVVCEGANMPTTPEAIDYLIDNNILFGPAKAANAGGVAVSGLEMTQNVSAYPWTFNEVDEKLKLIMKNIFKKIDETAKRFNKPENLVFSANITGFLKIYEAMAAQGVV